MDNPENFHPCRQGNFVKIWGTASLNVRFPSTKKLFKNTDLHTFVEIDHEIISTVILLPSADLFKKGCCQLQAKVCAQITG